MEMTFESWLDKVNKSQELKSQIKEASQLEKDLKRTRNDLDYELVEHSIQNMLGDVERNGKTIRAKFIKKVRIKEKKADHTNRVEFLRRLADAGYGDEIKFFESATIDEDSISFHEDGYIHGAKWDTVMSKIPSKILEQAVDDGLIYIDTAPKVTVT